MPKTRQQKEEAVVKLEEKLSRVKALVFADYKGLTMSQLSAVRKELRVQSSEFVVIKNNLLELALKSTNFKLPTTNLKGPIATLFAYDDQIAPIKILVKAFKDFAKGQVKSGFLDNEILDEAKILQLSTLPSKDELRAKTVRVLVAPLRGMLSVLNGNLRNLVYALNQIRISKGGDAQASS